MLVIYQRDIEVVELSRAQCYKLSSFLVLIHTRYIQSFAPKLICKGSTRIRRALDRLYKVLRATTKYLYTMQKRGSIFRVTTQ